ncbi:sigma factor-like helix-turn-helix DNA-binding protein [Kitasatospora sp. HPMI-4]|uniref:sigma factor-like helix-turn-helix DNA-binding protein n=1 Tax=Kitasatospora sp. HPMI-4 TaxID=3448443 RepID=UPI003F1B6FBA
MVGSLDGGCADAHGGTPSQQGLPERLPLVEAGNQKAETTLPDDLVALMVMQGEVYWEYARLHLDDADAADDLVDDVFADLAAHWGIVLRQESVEEFCWGVLRGAVDAELARLGRPSAFTAAAAFACAMGDARRGFAELESKIGLFSAIGDLPKRQHDVVVLTYVLGYPLGTAARIMGITLAGVYSLRRDARRRLATALGLDVRTAEEAEDQ